ncbi:MAG: YceI family protein [Tahibacter sp.]
MFGFATLGLAMGGVAAETIPFDATRSHAEFEVRAMWLFDVEGRFGGVSGSVILDSAARSAQVDALIDAGSIDMHRDSYEEWVKSSEFFDVARYPQIHFLSEPFPLAMLDDGGDIAGALTVRGVTRQASFNLRPSECTPHAARSCPVLADGIIQRTDFGMTTHRATLSDRVRLHFTVFAAASVDRS